MTAARPTPYDAFAEVYDAWCDSAPVAARNLAFYVETCCAADGPVVELGAGNGRIALEVAARGVAIRAVDDSAGMLDVLRARAAERGLADRVHCIQADMRAFEVDEPAGLVTIPFHSFGHMLTPGDRRRVIERAFSQLAPGGRLVFDHFVFDPELAAQHRAPAVRAEYVDARTGQQVVLWSISSHDPATQVIRVLTWTDSFARDGEVAERRYRRLSLGWVEPDEIRAHLTATGFEVEHLWGDFDRAPFGPDSGEQIWVARKP